MNEFFQTLSSIHNLPDVGMDDPRLPPMIEETIERYKEISGSTDISDWPDTDDETKAFAKSAGVQAAWSSLLGEIHTAGVNVTSLSDDEILPYVEVAVDNQWIRHYGAEARVFPVRLWSGRNAQVPASLAHLLRRLPEARRTGANDKAQMCRISGAARLVEEEIVSMPYTPDTHFEIQEMIAEEMVYHGARRGAQFPDMSDEDIYSLAKTVRAAKMPKIVRMIRKDSLG